MRYKIKAINTILLFGVMTICSACTGQNTSESKSRTLVSQGKSASIGSTIAEMDKSVRVIFQENNDHGLLVHKINRNYPFTNACAQVALGCLERTGFVPSDGRCALLRLC